MVNVQNQGLQAHWTSGLRAWSSSSLSSSSAYRRGSRGSSEGEERGAKCPQECANRVGAGGARNSSNSVVVEAAAPDKEARRQIAVNIINTDSAQGHDGTITIDTRSLLQSRGEFDGRMADGACRFHMNGSKS